VKPAPFELTHPMIPGYAAKGYILQFR